jgi:hypothetical protein
MSELTNAFVGVSLRDYLLRESGIEIKEFRLALDEAALRDLRAFWSYKKLGAFPENRARQIIADALSGGQLGKRRVKINLEKTNSIEVLNSNLNLLSSEIVAFFAPKAKLLNFARFQIRCVKAHLEIIGNLEEQGHLQDMNKNEIKKLQNIADELMNQKIYNQKSLEQWIETSHNLLTIISQKFPENFNPSGDESMILSSRLKKGFISQKNLPTYYKHWKNYCFNKLEDKIQSNFIIEDNNNLNLITKDLGNFVKVSDAERDQRIISNLDYQDNLNQKEDKNSLRTNLMKREFDLDNRKLTISHNNNLLTKNLINPLIANIKTQFMIKPEMDILNTSISNEGNILEIKLQKPRKADIALIEEILLNL